MHCHITTPSLNYSVYLLWLGLYILLGCYIAIFILFFLFRLIRHVRKHVPKVSFSIKNSDRKENTIQTPYFPVRTGEIKVNHGDKVVVTDVLDDGYCNGKNLSTNETGKFPVSCLSDADLRRLFGDTPKYEEEYLVSDAEEASLPPLPVDQDITLVERPRTVTFADGERDLPRDIPDGINLDDYVTIVLPRNAEFTFDGFQEEGV